MGDYTREFRDADDFEHKAKIRRERQQAYDAVSRLSPSVRQLLLDNLQAVELAVNAVEAAAAERNYKHSLLGMPLTHVEDPGTVARCEEATSRRMDAAIAALKGEAE